MWDMADMQIEWEIDWSIGTNGEYLWHNHKEERKKKRWANHEFSKALLKEKWYYFKERPNSHFIIWDYHFWGTTWKFVHIKTKKEWRWVYNLIKTLEWKK